jgi:PAS domain S-box-containing protein
MEAGVLFASLGPGAPLGVAIADASLRYVFLSPSFADAGGSTAEEAIGQPVGALLPGAVGERVQACMRAVLERGEPVLDEELSTAEGLHGTWLLSYYPLEDHGRPLVGVVVVDIHDRRLAEERLTESRRRLAQAQALASLGSYTRDYTAGTSQWSPQALALTGHSPSAPTPDREAWLSTVDAESRGQVRAAARAAEEDGRPYDLYFRQRWADGSTRILRTRGWPVRDAGGRVVRLDGFTQDVTLLRRAEIQQRAIAGLGQAALGGLPLRELMERACEVVVATLELEHVRACDREGAPVAEVGARPAAADVRAAESVPIGGDDPPYGTLRAESLRAGAIAEDDVAFLQAVANVLGSAVDRLRGEDEVADQAAARGRLVAQALDAEDRTRAAISESLHDGPLQDMLTLVQDLARIAARDDQEAEHLRRARDGVTRAIGQLREIMVDLHPMQLEVGGLESALGAVAAQQARHGGFACSVTIDPAARGLRDELVLSLARELLMNAARHAHASHVDVDVRREPGAVVLEVRDDGAGIPDGRLPTAAGEGHIGLASSIQRVEAVGGRLTLDGAAGTRAVAVLPVD